MARVPSASTRSVGSQIKVSASDIKTQRTTLPQVGDTSNFGIIAKAMTQLGADVDQGAKALRAAGAIEQHNADVDALDTANRTLKKGNLDARFGSLAQGVAGQGPVPVPGYRDLQGSNFISRRDSILNDSETRRQTIRETLPPALQDMFDRKSQDEQDSFRLGVENYNVQQSEIVRQEAVNGEATFLIDSYVKHSAASREDGASLEEMTIVNRHLVEDMVDLKIKDLDARGVTDEKQRTQEIKVLVESMHISLTERMLVDRDTKGARGYLKGITTLGEVTADGKTKILKAIRVVENANVAALTDAVSEWVAVNDSGATADPAVGLQLQRMLEVSGGERAKILLRSMNESIANRKAVADFRITSIADQTAEIKADLANERDPGTVETASQVRQRQAKQKNLAATQAAITRGDGLLLAEEYGMIEKLNALQRNNPASYRERVLPAEQATNMWGVYIAPLSKAEIDSIVTDISGVSDDGSTPPSPETLADTMKAMAQGLGREAATDLAAEAIKSNDTAAWVFGNAAELDPKLLAQVIQGHRAAQANKDLRPKPSELSHRVREFFGDTFLASTLETRPSFIAAAEALYIARGGGQDEDGTFNKDLFEQAMTDVSGGVLQHGGRKFIAPIHGFTQERMDTIIDNMTDEDLVKWSRSGEPPVHGRPFDAAAHVTSGEPVPAEDLKKFFDTAQLVSVGPGQYALMTPGTGMAITPSGEAYMLDLRGMIDSGEVENRDTAPQGALPQPFSGEPSVSDFDPRVGAVGEPVPQFIPEKDPDAAAREELRKRAPAETPFAVPEGTPFKEQTTIEEKAEEASAVEAKEAVVPAQPTTVAELKEKPFGEGAGRDAPLVDADDAAMVWGKVYQTESDTSKEADFVGDVKRFAATASDAALAKIASIRDTIAEVFAGDEGTDVAKVQSLATQIAVHESEGLTKVKQDGGGPARGIFQVELNTAKSLIFNSDLIGPKAIAKLAEEGWDIAKGFTDTQLKKFLENDVISTVFGVAQLLSGAKEKGELALLQGEAVVDSVVGGATEAVSSLAAKIVDAVSPIGSAKADDLGEGIASVIREIDPITSPEPTPVAFDNPKTKALTRPDAAAPTNAKDAKTAMEWVDSVWQGVAKKFLTDTATDIAVGAAGFVAGRAPSDASQMLVRDIVAKNLLGVPMDRDVLSIRDLRPTTVLTAKRLARKAIAANRKSIRWADYGTDLVGIPISGLIGGKGRAIADKAYPRNAWGIAAIGIMTMVDPKFDMALTIGQASLHTDKDGNTILTDEYDAEKFLFGSASKGGYGVLRAAFQMGGTLEDSATKKIKFRLNLGKL
jgi:hypothetical protein